MKNKNNENKVPEGYKMFTYKRYVESGWKEVHDSVSNK